MGRLDRMGSLLGGELSPGHQSGYGSCRGVDSKVHQIPWWLLSEQDSGSSYNDLSIWKLTLVRLTQPHTHPHHHQMLLTNYREVGSALSQAASSQRSACAPGSAPRDAVHIYRISNISVETGKHKGDKSQGATSDPL